MISEVALARLTEAGWTPLRAVPVHYPAFFGDAAIPAAVVQFCARFGGLQIHLPGLDDELIIAYPESLTSENLTSINRVEWEIGERLFPVGWFTRGPVVVYMDDRGRLFGAMDDYLTLLGNTAEDAINAICEERRTPVISWFPRDCSSEDVCQAIDDAVSAGESWRAQRLTLELASGTEVVREKVLKALAVFGDPRTAKPLIEFAEYASNPRLVLLALDALLQIPAPESLRSLETRLGDYRDFVRTRVIEILGEIGDRQSMEALEKCSEDTLPCACIGDDGEEHEIPGLETKDLAAKAVQSIRERLHLG